MCRICTKWEWNVPVYSERAFVVSFWALGTSDDVGGLSDFLSDHNVGNFDKYQPIQQGFETGMPRRGSQEPSLIVCTIINSSSSDLGTQLLWQDIIYHLYKQINTAWCVSIHVFWDIFTYLSPSWDVLIGYWTDYKNSSSCNKCLWAAGLGDIAS